VGNERREEEEESRGSGSETARADANKNCLNFKYGFCKIVFEYFKRTTILLKIVVILRFERRFRENHL